jgi:hypothetical protein
MYTVSAVITMMIVATLYDRLTREVNPSTVAEVAEAVVEDGFIEVVFGGPVLRRIAMVSTAILFGWMSGSWVVAVAAVIVELMLSGMTFVFLAKMANK